MSFNLNFKFLLSLIAVSSTFAFTGNPTVAQTKVAQNSFPTTFNCIRQQDGLHVTVARRGNRQTSPLFVWKSNSWGSKYPPEKRCSIVSQRLTNAVATNGGKLSGLYMTHGIVNKYPVICYINDPNGGCTSSNILLTLPLSEKSFKKRNDILQSMAEFSKKGTGTAVTRGSSFVELEDVDNAFTQNAVNEFPTTETTPNNNVPVNPIPETTSPSQPAEKDMSI